MITEAIAQALKLGSRLEHGCEVGPDGELESIVVLGPAVACPVARALPTARNGASNARSLDRAG